MIKSLDRKLAAIHADANCREFILADAKDADMALGLGAAGESPEMHAGEVRFKTLAEYREQMRLITRQGFVDIMLMSASSSYALTIRERLFDGSAVTPAVRANDTTDIHLARAQATRQSLRGRSGLQASITFSAATSTAPRTSARWGPTWVFTASRSTTISHATWRRSSTSIDSVKRPSARASAISSKFLIPTSQPPSQPTFCPTTSTT